MKKKVEKMIALVMCAVMLIGIAPLSGFVGIDLPDFGKLFVNEASAATSGTYGDLSYLINYGEVTITGCDRNASGGLVIPDTIEGYPVTSIGSFAFYDCTGLTSITIPDSVSSIDDGAFWGCTGLTSITIPDSVTSIGVDAFSFCTGLTSITISDSVTSIGDSAFAYCDGLTDVYFTGSEEEWNAISIGSENDYLLDANIHFNYSNSTDPLSVLTYEIINGEVTIAGCDKNASGELEIPGTIEGYPVTSIGVYAFAGCADLTSITIPDSVTSIGYGAFSGCTGLTSITIPDNVTSIGDFTFDCCAGLTSIIIPDSVTSIGDGTFIDCTGLISIIIPDSVTSIDNFAFYDCTGLTDVYFTGSEQEWHAIVIGEGNDCLLNANIHYNYIVDPLSVLTYEIDGGGKVTITGCDKNASGELDIPNTIDGYPVTSIGNFAFEYCYGLTNITIPVFVKKIGIYAFGCCTGLTEIAIPDSVTSIGDSAFYGCTGLTSITIPDSVTSIGEGAFFNCDGLTEITIPDSVTSIGDGAFLDCDGLTEITIPDSVTSIGDSAFNGCTGLTSITIPDSVTSIGNSAFSLCTGLTSVTIPDSVTSIGSGAFEECTSLTDVYFTGSEEEWNAIEIGKYNHCLTNATIHYNHEHSYTSEITVNPTCTTDGEMTYTCECGDTYTVVILSTGHKPASPVKENIVPATSTDGGSYDEVVYCSVCSVELSRRTVFMFISGEIDKTAVVRGNQGVWTVKTTDAVEWLRFNGTYTTSAGNTYNLTVYYKASYYMNATEGVTVSDINGERVWTVPMTFNFSGRDDTVKQTWSVTYKVKNSSVWVDSPYSQEITIGKTEQSIAPKPLDYAPYSLVSANCDFTEIGKGNRGDITIVTTNDCNKVRITYTDAATGKTKASTFQTTSKSNVSFTDDATTGLRTWTIGYKFAAAAQNNEFRIDTRGIEWTETKTVNVEVK